MFSLLKGDGSKPRVPGAAAADEGVTVYCSFMQVYNELVFDLLRDPNTTSPLAIHETVEEGVFVEGLTEFVVASPADCLEIVRKGQANRCVCCVCVPLCVCVLLLTPSHHTFPPPRVPPVPSGRRT